MPPRPKYEPGLPSNALSHDIFAAQMASAERGVESGRVDPVNALRVAASRYLHLDPLSTIKAEITSKAMLHSAMGRVASLHETVVDNKRSRRRLSNSPRAHLMGAQARLDQAELGMGLPNVTAEQTRDSLRKVEHNLSNLEDRHESSGKEQDVTVSRLTARAMKIHLQAMEIANSNSPDHLKRNSLAFLEAEAASLVQDTIKGLVDVHDKYKQKPSDVVGGAMTEHMYFAYSVMKWYRSGYEGLVDGYPRFALIREDNTKVSAKPKRSFDIVKHTGQLAGTPILTQVKASARSVYEEGIQTWSPQENPIDNADKIVGWFEDIVSNETSDSEAAKAWRRVDRYFSESKVNAPETTPGPIKAAAN